MRPRIHRARRQAVPSLAAFALAASLSVGTAYADVLTMANGDLRFDLWVQTIDVRPDGVRVIADRLDGDTLAGKPDRFAGFDFETIAFRYLDEAGKQIPGRVAVVTTPEGEIRNDITIESAVWGEDGFIFTCRDSAVAPGGETFTATTDHVRLIEFSPVPFSMRHDVEPVLMSVPFPKPGAEPVPPPIEPIVEPVADPSQQRNLLPGAVVLFLAGGIFTAFVLIALGAAIFLIWYLLKKRTTR